MPCDKDHPDLFEPDNETTCERQNDSLARLLGGRWRFECLASIWRTGLDANDNRHPGWAACRRA
jgi:hypothetical protein